MHQRSFGSVEYAHTKGKTRRQQFLERMDRLVPAGGAHRARLPAARSRPYPLRPMLRIHCLRVQPQRPRHATPAMLEFAGLWRGDETHAFPPPVGAAVRDQRTSPGLQVRAGTIVDSTIISAPSSTKNQARARDPEMIRPGRAGSGSSG